MTREEIAQYIKSELAKDDAEIYLDIDDYKIIVEALEQEPCETIKEIPKDYKYDTETEDFLVYRHIYTGHEIHIEKPVPRYRLEQEPKTGHWIYLKHNKARCSECDDVVLLAQAYGKANYFPNCGAKMESEEEK